MFLKCPACNTRTKRNYTMMMFKNKGVRCSSCSQVIKPSGWYYAANFVTILSSFWIVRGIYEARELMLSEHLLIFIGVYMAIFHLLIWFVPFREANQDDL